jgi:leucyl/phenylalanyl-tRNA--protein transferase
VPQPFVPILGPDLTFPSPDRSPWQGLVAIGGDLSPARLLNAYRAGIFPWSVEPITWWSPEPRAIFEFDKVHIPRSLQRTLRREKFRVTFNRSFGQVIRACASVPREDDGTWITPTIIEAYEKLHQDGWAHSIECWHGDQLAGGVYGVAIGGLFAGESMFHHVSDASKVALIRLLGHLHQRGFTLFDTQMLTETTRALGAVEIRRREYLARLRSALKVSASFGDPPGPPQSSES